MFEKLTAAECTEQLEELAERRSELSERLKEIRPPRQAPPVPSGGTAAGMRSHDPLKGSGPEYRRIVEAGTPEEFAAMERERDTISGELTQLAFRVDALQSRRKVAEAEEAKAAAPAELKALAKRLPELLDRADAALQEADRALEDCSAWLLEARRQHEHLDESPRVVEPVMLYRLGMILRHRLVEEETRRLGGVTTPEKVSPALFRSYEQLMQAERLLGEPDRSLIERLRRSLFGDRGQTSEVTVDFRRRRAKLLAEGSLKAVEAAPEPQELAGTWG